MVIKLRCQNSNGYCKIWKAINNWPLNQVKQYQPSILLSVSRAWTSLGSNNFYFLLAAGADCSREDSPSSTYSFPFSHFTISQHSRASYTARLKTSCSTTLKGKVMEDCLHLTKVILFPLLFFKKKGLFSSLNSFNFSISLPTQSHNPPFVTSQLIVAEVIEMSQTEDNNFR